MAREHILVIEDDPAVARAIRISLEGYGFAVSLATTGAEGLALTLSRTPPQTVLLDLGLPDMDGLEVCTRIRAQSTIPLIILTARGAEHEKISALESGADDYVTKPFGMGELLARIRVGLRHAAQRGVPDRPRPLQVGQLIIDLTAHQVLREGHVVHLTPTEFTLLETLARNAGRISMHQMLLRAVWGPGYGSETQLLRVFIAQLRNKLELNPADPQYILTEPSIGYRFAPLDTE